MTNLVDATFSADRRAGEEPEIKSISVTGSSRLPGRMDGAVK